MLCLSWLNDEVATPIILVPHELVSVAPFRASKVLWLNLLHCIDSTFQLTATQSQPGSQPQCKKPTQISKSVLLTNFANLPINRFLSLDSSIRIGHRGRADKVNHLTFNIS